MEEKKLGHLGTTGCKSYWLALIALLLFLAPAVGHAQTKLPSGAVADLKGRSFDIANLSNNGKPIVMVFFDTNCKPCLSELNRIADTYDDWVQETGVKLVAIALDDARNLAKVEPYVNSKEWNYEVYTDSEQHLKGALGITNTPTTLILDGDLNIVWRHTGFEVGDEDSILEKVREVGAN